MEAPLARRPDRPQRDREQAQLLDRAMNMEMPPIPGQNAVPVPNANLQAMAMQDNRDLTYIANNGKT